MTVKALVCVLCGNDIQHHSYQETPESLPTTYPYCVEVAKLEIVSQFGQHTTYENNVWLCHDCNERMAQNIARNARNAFEEKR